MASKVEDNLHCPSCLGIFKDPVILFCSHSFCRTCVQQWWEQKGDQTCPVCRAEFRSLDPPLNLALRNVCEAFSQVSVEAEESCTLHKEKFKLFCLDHQELVCVICMVADNHAGHKFRPLDEVVKCHKEKLQKGLQDAKERLKDCGEKRDNCNEQATYIKVQRKQVESKIKKDFEELRHFLQVEEEARLSAVREEEQKKTRILKKMIKVLDRDIFDLSGAIRRTQEQLMSDNVSFMKNFKTAMTRTKKIPDKPELLPGALLDEAKHVGNLKFNVWKQMKEMVSYGPVILDPNTASPGLSLSEDLTSVSFQGQQRPKNPERFEWNYVLGSALASGTHTWDVEVGDNKHWALGVMWGNPCLPHDMTACGIGFHNDNYIGFADLFRSGIRPVKPQRIRVQVDTNEGLVSISECLTNTQLCKTNPSSWPRLSAMKMFAFIRTSDTIPLRIIPLAFRVMTQSQ